MKLRILLADDHEIVRRGLRSLLENTKDGKFVVKPAMAARPLRRPSS